MRTLGLTYLGSGKLKNLVILCFDFSQHYVWFLNHR